MCDIVIQHFHIYSVEFSTGTLQARMEMEWCDIFNVLKRKKNCSHETSKGIIQNIRRNEEFPRQINDKVVEFFCLLVCFLFFVFGFWYLFACVFFYQFSHYDDGR